MKDALLVLDPSARTLRSNRLRAVFLPGRGMLGASLQHRGEELLGRVEEKKDKSVGGTPQPVRKR